MTWLLILRKQNLSSEYRMQVFQLGVVVGYSQFAEGDDSDILDDEQSVSSASMPEHYMSAEELDVSDSDASVDDLASLSTRRRIQIGKRKREAAEVDDVSKKPYDADTPAYDLENINKSYGRKYGQVPIG